MKRYLLYFVGWFFIVLGVIGTLIPVMPQTIFYVIGISILTGVSPRFRLWIRKLKDKHPKLKSFLDSFADRARAIKNWFRKGK